MRGRPGGDDRGAAVVEYVLVAALLMLVFLGVAQVALVLHARNVLVADAAEGARAGAVRGASVADGEKACGDLVRHSLATSVDAGRTPCHGAVLPATNGHPPLVRMEIDATLPLTFVPLGKTHLHAVARAVREPQ